MYDRLKRFFRDESGITALETAIILIAFVVVAAVFAFTVLSAGTTSTEKAKEAILSGLQEVSASLELRGAVLATENTPGAAGEGQIKNIVFTVGNVAGGTAIDLTSTISGTNKVVIDYRDAEKSVSGLQWSVDWPVRHDEDNLLEDGELAKITIDLTDTKNGITLGTDTTFAIEVKPPRGGVLLIQKTTPSYIDTVIDFH
ncbi:MAG TPA: hypothetical protein PLJ35_10185 [Anaerolineae bacterium]|nr:hypothetical protein [Anaerolineae bacterium]